MTEPPLFGADPDRPAQVRGWMRDLLHVITNAQRAQHENDLQAGLESVFRDAGLWYRREVPHKRGRLDFLVVSSDGLRVGIELKVKGSLAALTRQIFDYLQGTDLEGMIVVTTRQAHRDLPTELAGRPVMVHWISYP